MLIVLFWLLVSASCFGIGEYWSKVWSLAPTTPRALLLVFFYILGSLAWLPAIYKGQSLSVVGSIWNIICMGITLYVGLIMFKEPLNHYQMIGLGFALIAIVLLNMK
jgi:multidrug transporter EmrE-like cation transporter